MYIVDRQEDINGYHICMGRTVRWDREVFEVSMNPIVGEGMCGYPVRERTTCDKQSAAKTFSYYKRCAKEGR